MKIHIYHHIVQDDDCGIKQSLQMIINKLNQIQMTNEELVASLTSANAKVDKIKTEIQALIDIVAGSQNVPQAVVDAVNTLAGNLQSADDLNPDAPTP
jgi:prophage DNA circulation protein